MRVAKWSTRLRRVTFWQRGRRNRRRRRNSTRRQIGPVTLRCVAPPPPPLKKLPSYLGESLHPTTNTICTQDVVWTWRRNSYINCNFKWADSRRSNSVSPCLCCGVITLFIIHCSHNFRFNICRLCISWQESFPSLTNQTAPTSHPSLPDPACFTVLPQFALKSAMPTPSRSKCVSLSLSALRRPPRTSWRLRRRRILFLSAELLRGVLMGMRLFPGM